MNILCLGVSHRTATVALRERLAFSEEAAGAALARLGCGSLNTDGIHELVLLSTCNRVELYAVTGSGGAGQTALEALLEDARGVPAREFHPHLYCLEGEEAVEHLLRVAAGMDSLVLGEPQILGQVMRALELSRAQGAAGPVLSRLFQAAIHAGKRVRTETTIAQNPATISSAAVRLAAGLIDRLAEARVAVLGAGEMAELVVEALRKRQVSHFLVVNRTLERARELADRWQGQATTFENLAQALEEADFVIASTGAPHPVVHRPMVMEAMQKRPRRPLVLIDIAVPRDIDAEVVQVPGVSVYDMDALQDFLSRSLISRAMQMPEAQAILGEEKAQFMEYLAAQDLLPVIKAMHEQAEAIRQAELEKTLRRLPNLTPAERRRIEALSEALVNKLLHAPVTRLRSEAGQPQAAHFSYVARSLFGLHPGTLPHGGSFANPHDPSSIYPPDSPSAEAPA
jgi:glutamyl-tRNA reductase